MFAKQLNALDIYPNKKKTHSKTTWNKTKSIFLTKTLGEIWAFLNQQKHKVCLPSEQP